MVVGNVWYQEELVFERLKSLIESLGTETAAALTPIEKMPVVWTGPVQTFTALLYSSNC